MELQIEKTTIVTEVPPSEISSFVPESEPVSQGEADFDRAHTFTRQQHVGIFTIRYYYQDVHTESKVQKKRQSTSQ